MPHVLSITTTPIASVILDTPEIPSMSATEKPHHPQEFQLSILILVILHHVDQMPIVKGAMARDHVNASQNILEIPM
jgi:hypothetical protein